jgi:hypothetical protein
MMPFNAIRGRQRLCKIDRKSRNAGALEIESLQRLHIQWIANIH